MSLSQDLFGSTRTIPQTPETDWGAQVTQVLSDIMYALDTSMNLTSNKGLWTPEGATSALAADATLTASRVVHLVSGSGGAVTLNATTAIADGGKDNQIAILIGTSDSNTVTILDGANTKLNGRVTLGEGEVMIVLWRDAASYWVELFRNNFRNN
ncbi:MAG: hypothetical protein ACYTAN_18550 [Planctomycetota bacterium]|jgi:hypothetical protein